VVRPVPARPVVPVPDAEWAERPGPGRHHLSPSPSAPVSSSRFSSTGMSLSVESRAPTLAATSCRREPLSRASDHSQLDAACRRTGSQRWAQPAGRLSGRPSCARPNVRLRIGQAAPPVRWEKGRDARGTESPRPTDGSGQCERLVRPTVAALMLRVGASVDQPTRRSSAAAALLPSPSRPGTAARGPDTAKPRCTSSTPWASAAAVSWSRAAACASGERAAVPRSWCERVCAGGAEGT